MNGLFLAKAKCFPINFYILLVVAVCLILESRSSPIVIGIANSSVHNLMSPWVRVRVPSLKVHVTTATATLTLTLDFNL